MPPQVPLSATPNRSMTRRALLAVAGATASVLASCGLGDNGEEDPATQEPTATTAATQAPPEPTQPPISSPVAGYLDPDRWAGNERTVDLAQMKTCFLGFGYGSRQCIGRGVANQFVMKMMARVLLRYDVQLQDPSLELGAKEFTIQKPDKKYNVILKRR